MFLHDMNCPIARIPACAIWPCRLFTVNVQITPLGEHNKRRNLRTMYRLEVFARMSSIGHLSRSQIYMKLSIVSQLEKSLKLPLPSHGL